ncbi:hypothetical protein BaOVIS_018970 [Babesia ovis]|uniref:Uncharacterized protein n=1 Tax=Babesia ovis TaxID=5869 RepID=A0A9W5WV21_BABOV|nr:hypothetical protein BaOVIS_018970 [Babesia ovis]
MRVCCLIVLFQVVAAANIELGTTTRSNSTVSSRFMPSSLPLYPLDFQDNWQASRPIPVDVNFSVPNFGPRDLTNYIQEAARSSDLLAKQMEPDLEYMPLQNLQMLNGSLEKLKSDAVMRLHALHKVNHDLLTENARLRQRTREFIRQKREKEQQLAQPHAARVPTGTEHRVFTEQTSPGALKGVYIQARKSSPISVSVQMCPNFTAVVETVISLSTSQLSDYYRAEPANFDYKMILIETKNGIVENASTVVTRNAKVTLRKLQMGVVYHVTVHCTVPNSERRLTAETKFVYKHVAPEEPTPPPEVTEDKQPEPQAPITLDNDTYKLNVQIGEEDYLTCNFAKDDNLETTAKQFIAQHRLKPVLTDGLITTLEQLRDSGVTIRNVDVSDLL